MPDFCMQHFFWKWGFNILNFKITPGYYIILLYEDLKGVVFSYTGQMTPQKNLPIKLIFIIIVKDWCPNLEKLKASMACTKTNDRTLWQKFPLPEQLYAIDFNPVFNDWKGNIHEIWIIFACSIIEVEWI